MQGEQVKNRKKGAGPERGQLQKEGKGASPEKKRAAPAGKKNPYRGDGAEKKKGQR